MDGRRLTSNSTVSEPRTAYHNIESTGRPMSSHLTRLASSCRLVVVVVVVDTAGSFGVCACGAGEGTLAMQQMEANVVDTQELSW